MRANCFEPSPTDSESDPREGKKLARRITIRLEIVIVTLILIIAAISSLGEADLTGWHRQSHEAISIHNGRIEGLAFAPDGKLAASASRDGSVMVWDVGPKPSWGVAVQNAAGFSCVAFAPDGKTVAAGGLDGTIALWDADSGEVVRLTPLRSNGAVRALAFVRGGESVAAGSDDGVVRILDVVSGRETLVMRGHHRVVNGLACSPDGRTLASASMDSRVILWGLDSGLALKEFDGDCGPLWSVAYAPGGRSLAIGGDQGITLCEIATGRTATLRTHDGNVTAVRYLPDGARLASSSLDGAVILWEIAPDGLHFQSRLSGQQGRVKAMAVSADGSTLVTGGDDTVLRRWSLTDSSLDNRRVRRSRSY
jgi:WD40 repeat protein